MDNDFLNSQDIARICQIIRSAGDAILEEYSKDFSPAEIKADHSPLTQADLRSNAIIEEGLKSLSVQYPYVSEENLEIPAGERQDLETYWLVDPLDGTREFINRNGEFAICIALIHKSKAVVGFVFAPTAQELCLAIKDKGAFIEKGGLRTKLNTSPFDPSQEKLRFAVSRSHRSPDINSYIEKFENPIYKTKGSILKMVEIAKGSIDIYPRFDQKTKEWDIAAGQIILEEAGGSVIHSETQKSITYNKITLNNPPFIASANPL